VQVLPVVSAEAAGLRYVNDAAPGIRRMRAGKGFYFIHPDGKPLRDREEVARIQRLGIPPAWTDVWICPFADGHIQATGRDARGRKQYRYHQRFREVRDETKYHRLLAFAEALPALRRRVDEDMARPGLPREKVLATVVRLLEQTFIRIGNDEYARTNSSFGLTTLRDEHVEVHGQALRFSFRGKAGKDHTVDIRDARLARIVKRCQDLPGEELFQYIDEDGQQKTIHSNDVNDYLREITGQPFTAKDFRTWAGTVLAAQELKALGPAGTQRQAKSNIVRAVDTVAARLGNTRAVCKRCYIHPILFDAYVEGSLAPQPEAESGAEVVDALASADPEAAESALVTTLPPHEAWVVRFLEVRIAAMASRPSLEDQLRGSLEVSVRAVKATVARARPAARASAKATVKRARPAARASASASASAKAPLKRARPAARVKAASTKAQGRAAPPRRARASAGGARRGATGARSGSSGSRSSRGARASSR